MTLSITYIGTAIGIVASILAIIDAIKRPSKFRFLKALLGGIVIILLSILLQREVKTINNIAEEKSPQNFPEIVPANNQPAQSVTQTTKIPEKVIKKPVESKADKVDLAQPSNKYVSDYLIINSNTNQFEEILPEIQTAIEEKGNSASIENFQNYSFPDLQGKYKKLIVANARLEYKSSSIDSRVVCASYSCTIKIYNVDTQQSIIIVDGGSEIGFSEMEASGKVKQKIREKIKSSI